MPRIVSRPPERVRADAPNVRGSPARAPEVPIGPSLGAAPAAPSPIDLTGEARKAHVRTALLDFEGKLLLERPELLAAKLEKLKASPFVFFRGTADLFYRDLAGVDLDKPAVMLSGDVHPENLGVRRTPGGELFYGFDDFDEAHRGPFTWDLRRGATALQLAARDEGMSDEAAKKIAEAFVGGYFDAVREARASPPSEDAPRFPAGEGPHAIRDVLEDAGEQKRKAYLSEWVEDGRFRSDHPELRRKPSMLAAVRAALSAYRRSLSGEAPGRGGFYAVKDVAEKLGSGTGSIGQRRWFVLLEGKSEKDKDDVILELKETRPSVLERHVPMSALDGRSKSSSSSVDHLWAAGDRFAGKMTVSGVEYRVRERLPKHGRVDYAELGKSELAEYARAMGALAADLHLTGRTGGRKNKAKDVADTAKRILAAGDTKALRAELVAWSSAAADRVTGDHAAFVELLAAGKLGV